MKTSPKRIQFIHRTHNGQIKKWWQNVHFDKMITLEHVWNDMNQHLALTSTNQTCSFFYYNTKTLLPNWYHVNLLNDNDQIVIEESMGPTSPPTLPVPTIEVENIKPISKKKQLKTSLTNRSFIITNKYSVSDSFYEEWKAGQLHVQTKNCCKIF